MFRTDSERTHSYEDAVAEYMRWLEQDRQRKPSTLRDYGSITRAHLLPAFGGRCGEDITTEQVEGWSAQLAARWASLGDCADGTLGQAPG